MPRQIDALPPARDVRIRLLCLGFSRTGTTSLRDALVELGYHPYKFLNVFSHQHHADCWIEAINAKFHGKGQPYGREEFDKLFAGYDVC